MPSSQAVVVNLKALQLGCTPSKWARGIVNPISASPRIMTALVLINSFLPSTLQTTTSQGDHMEPYYGLKSRAGDDGILIAQDGLNAGWANSCGRDFAFVDAMIDQVKASL